MSDKKDNCPLCLQDGGTLIWRNDDLRVIHTPEPGFPAFYRVVWNQHVAELSDLNPAQRVRVLDIIILVEQALRDILSPDKINIVSLGNMVPHLHFHIIARFKWDSHFPDAVWAPAVREQNHINIRRVELKLPDICTYLVN